MVMRDLPRKKPASLVVLRIGGRVVIASVGIP